MIQNFMKKLRALFKSSAYCLKIDWQVANSPQADIFVLSRIALPSGTVDSIIISYEHEWRLRYQRSSRAAIVVDSILPLPHGFIDRFVAYFNKLQSCGSQSGIAKDGMRFEFASSSMTSKVDLILYYPVKAPHLLPLIEAANGFLQECEHEEGKKGAG